VIHIRLHIDMGKDPANRKTGTLTACDGTRTEKKKKRGHPDAKKEGTTLSTVSEQSAHYGESLPDFLANLLPGTKKIPFAYESTGVETLFRDERDPQPRSRRVYAFHQPATLAAWLAGAFREAFGDYLIAFTGAGALALVAGFAALGIARGPRPSFA